MIKDLKEASRPSNPPKRSQGFLFLFSFLFVSLFLLTRGFSLEVGLTPEQWKEDLEYLARQLPKRHKNLFHTISKEQFERKVADLSKRFPDMTELEIRIGLAEIVSSVGDIHTYTEVSSTGGPIVPIYHQKFGKDIYAVTATEEYSSVMGARLVGIGTHSIEEVVDRIRPILRLETEQMLFVDLPGWISSVDFLRIKGLWGSGESAIFRYERNGEEFPVEIKPFSGMPNFISSKKVPMYRANAQTAYWFRFLEDGRVLYIQYNSCDNMESLSFEQFTRQVTDAANLHPINKVIIDLRHNRGGNSEVINPLLKALQRDPFRQARLYAITSPKTMSAGTRAACRLKTKLNAVVVGEPSAQKLTGYQDSRTFKLPNSGITVFYSTKFFNYDCGEGDLLIPDSLIPMTADDYIAGRDPVLERILTK